jgi:hypothetical protein
MQNGKLRTTLVAFLAIFTISITSLSAQDLEEFDQDPFFSDPLSSFRDLPQRYTKRVRTNIINSTFEGIDHQHGYDYAAFNALNRYGTMGALSPIRFNRVDGLVVGFGWETQQFENNEQIFDLNVAGNLSYSFGQDEFQYQLALELPLANSLLIGAEWHNHTTTTDTWKMGAKESAVSSFLTGFDYLNYFSAKGFSAYVTTKPKIIQLSAGYHWNRYSSLDLQTRYSMFGGKSSVMDNTPISEGKAQSVSGILNFNPRNLQLIEGLSVQASLFSEIADHGDLDLGDLRFNRYIANVKSYLRLGNNALINWRGIAYAVTSEGGNIPIQFNGTAGGPGTVMAQPLNSLQGTHLLVSNLELMFGRKKNINVIWSSNDHDYLDFDIDFDIDDPVLGVFWDWGMALNPADKFSNNPMNGFTNSLTEDLMQTVGAVVTMGSLQFRLGWDPKDFNQPAAFLIRLNPRF